MGKDKQKRASYTKHTTQLWTVGYLVFWVVSLLFIFWLFFYLPYLEAVETAQQTNYYELQKK